MEHIWGRESTKTFFGHVCPALYAYKTLAYWAIEKHVHSQEFLTAIEHMTQVEDKLALQVKKAGRRYDPRTFESRGYKGKGLTIALTNRHNEQCNAVLHVHVVLNFHLHLQI